MWERSHRKHLKHLERGGLIYKQQQKKPIKQTLNVISPLPAEPVSNSVTLPIGDGVVPDACPWMLPGAGEDRKVFSAVLCSSFYQEMSCSDQTDHAAAAIVHKFFQQCPIFSTTKPCL